MKGVVSARTIRQSLSNERWRAKTQSDAWWWLGDGGRRHARVVRNTHEISVQLIRRKGADHRVFCSSSPPARIPEPPAYEAASTAREGGSKREGRRWVGG